MEFLKTCFTQLRNVLPLLIFWLIILSFTTPTSATVISNETDHLSLIAFRDKITNDPFGALKSWNDSLHFCMWNGVICGRRHRQRVVSLQLNSYNLDGELSPSIGNLSFLRILNLSNNLLQGPIPHQITHLFRLQILFLGNNSLVGTIPTNFSALSSLKYLHLTNNNLEGEIPDELGCLQNLEILRINRNSFIGSIPSSLGNLSSLVELVLERNNFSGNIPPELAQLRKLKAFALYANQLTGNIPYQIYNMSYLVVFTVDTNKLHGNIPWDIGLTLPNLQWFGVGDNQFSGPVPISLVNCSQLTTIVANTNHFTGSVPQDLGRLQYLYRLSLGINRLGSNDSDDLHFLSSLTNCTHLETIYLNANSLRGFLPNSIANLSSQLKTLRLAGNRIYGSIPSGLYNLKSLDSLYLFDNEITGIIPDDVGKMVKLQQLYLHNNRLTGEIPLTLGNLTLLSDLLLDRNNISGKIPPSLGKCLSLTALDISDCYLTGSIPNQLFNQTIRLISLNLGRNALTGHLPFQVGDLKHLEYLNVAGNNLSGRIPETLGESMNMRYLLLQGNFFEGTLPLSLSVLRGLEFLDVSNNNLTGNVPQFLGKLPFLNYLNLSFNDLAGAVPGEGVFLNASAITVEGNNMLCGGIPELRLPECSVPSFKDNKKKSSFVLKAIIPAICGTISLVVLAYLCLFCRKRKISRTKEPSISVFDHQFPKISYRELSKATNNFSNDCLIGAGSFGSVYKGILNFEQRIVAVKVLNLLRRGGSKSFMSECRALRNVRHRNLVKILTACSTVDHQGNDFKALIFDFMPNGSLEKWLHPEQGNLESLNLMQRLNVAIDVASALEYLHWECESRVVHGDLKPSNVLLDAEMTAHLSDFGISKILSSDSDNTGQSGTSSFSIKGSVGYVPPEYGLGCDVSPEGDVYSYGILLLEMFTGKEPTSDEFMNGLSLHTFVKSSLAEKVEEITDPLLLFKDDKDGRSRECLLSVMKVGVSCSMDSPKERMDIKDVLKELRLIKHNI